MRMQQIKHSYIIKLPVKIVKLEPRKPDVFLSYNLEDHSAVEILAHRLREAGIEPWMDFKNLIPGQDFMDVIKVALDQCRICLVCIGARGVKPWHNSEIQSAIYNRINEGDFNVIPVLLPGANREGLSDLPAFVQSVQWLEFPESVDDEESFRQLLAAIREASGESGQGEKQNSKQSARSDREKSPIKPARAVKRTIQLPDIDWVEIPAGKFIYGEDSSKKTLTLDRFFISRYPTTNCQYQTFIYAGGYGDERWWQNLIKTGPGESTWMQPNRPRKMVTWYEAVAFTRWLSVQLGYAVTLPTEHQWEKAARGTDGREYPWGTGFNTGDANVNDASAGDDNLQQTTAVGLYPHRTSPDQVMDMAGNVWEWCLNKYDHPEHTTPDQSGDSRVLRGGSWLDLPGSARSSVRPGSNPDGRGNFVGYRVVCSSPYTNH
jgi:formylglycine-generating enzyme required for sulfatase activity